ncbi:MAG: L-2-amino-thiazoline-4-carboxylic acid hydrolase [Thermodesulfobacteriota bacterium]
MGADLSQMPTLLRREIEARIAGPLLRAFSEEFGRVRTLAVAAKVIEGLAQEAGAQLAKLCGGNTLAHLAQGPSLSAAGGALEKEILELSETTYNYNVTRCKYADMYRELGLADLGVVLSCGRDVAMFAGFNPRLKLTRSQTIMEGADYCDFRLSLT